MLHVFNIIRSDSDPLIISYLSYKKKNRMNPPAPMGIMCKISGIRVTCTFEMLQFTVFEIPFLKSFILNLPAICL